MTADYIQHSTIEITNMNEKPELEIAPIGVGIPRLDPYRRLLARFYEPLFLLKALGQTRGEHTPEPTNSDACMERRRRFLRNLAYVCDFKKGGDSCTAIGLENCPTGYCFWVASNKNSDEIISFLNKALGVLRGANSLPTSDLAATESDLTQLCTDFAIHRITLEYKNFQREAARCISRLRKKTTGTAEQIIDWLQVAMNFVDQTELCKFAYDHRVSVYIGKLTTEALQEESISGPAGMWSCFALARHHILRLAHHIRAPKELVADSCHLGHLLQAHNVRGADSLPSVPPPVRDSHTNLRGILNRMYSTDGEEKKTVEDGLLYLNRASFSNIFKHFMEQYTLPGTQVHAEVQVLEHFYRRRLSFVDGDKFVACSKPACLCCELYFRHHPARMVVPSSHCKVWTKWSPPLVKEFTKNSTAAREQKQIMSKITQALRDQIIDQVLRRTQMSQWHPDSRTCVTEFRPLDSFNLFEEQDKICKNGEFVADILDSTEGESEVILDSAEGESEDILDSTEGESEDILDSTEGESEDILDSTVGESEELVEDIDSDDGGVSIKV